MTEMIRFSLLNMQKEQVMPNVPASPSAKHAAIVSLSKWLVACTMLAALSIFSRRSDEIMRRTVIISSDDAGMCSSVNRGTIAALQAGVVRSTSIMTCCPAFEEFAEFARSHPQYDYGVHLTLTCDLKAPGWGAILPISEIPSLVADDGFFHSSTHEVARFASTAEVEAELRAQIRKAMNSGINISHLDHHMWVLFARPDLLRLYVQLGKEFSLPIRFSKQVPRRMLSAYGEEVLSTYVEQLKALEQNRVPILDAIEADNYSIPPSEKRPYLLTNLRNLRPGLTEIVIHCASPDGSSIEPPDAAARFADTANFSANEIRHELARLRIDVLDWRELRARQ
jgi:chitin disaccharide deacetylase